MFASAGNAIRNAFISVIAMIDGVLYSLLAYLYQIFFNVASANILSGDTVKNLFSRIQLILGVAIVFKLAITLINGIIDPDKITDGKSGAGKLVTRIITSLVLLILIVPLNIPTDEIEPGSYNAQLNNNGILFGTLYEFQNRILADNTLARLILGKETNSDNLSTSEDMAQSGKKLAVTILKSFITINMAEGKEGSDPLDNPADTICGDGDSDAQELIEDYMNNDSDVFAILNNVTAQCKGYHNFNYVFNYMFIISSVAIVIVLLIMLGFTLDIGIRAFKMAILRLVAPVPIISYVDTKSGDKNLESWSKGVSKTYIDVFLRVSLIYFIIFVIEEFRENGIDFNVDHGMVYGLSYVIAVIALFYFAREAPKFILESMGFKYEGGFFSGIGKMFGALRTAMNVPGAIRSAYKAKQDAIKASHDKKPGKWNTNKGLIALQTISSGVLRGGLGGLGAGMIAATGAKDHYGRAGTKAMQQRNAMMFAQADVGSTGLGRMRSSLSRTLWGESPAETGKREIANLEAKKNALEAVKSRVASEMIKQDWTTGLSGIRDGHGNELSFNYKKFKAALESAQSRGLTSFQIQDSNGVTQSVHVRQALEQIGYLQKMNEGNYLYEQLNGTAPKADDVLKRNIEEVKVRDAGWYSNMTSEISRINTEKTAGTFNGDYDNLRKGVNTTIDNLGNDIAEKKRINAANEQNDRFQQMNQK